MVFFDVLESLKSRDEMVFGIGMGTYKVHEATIASIISVFGGAINQVLFAQGNQISRRAFVLSFEGAGGGEGPA